MWAMITKEFRQLRRDKRTLAMLIFMPVLLLIIFGYAASFDVESIPVTVVGLRADQAAAILHAPFEVATTDPGGGRDRAEEALRNGDTPVALVTGSDTVTLLLDGSELFTAKAALAQLGRADSSAVPFTVDVEILYNPDLATSAVMVPGLGGLILLFIGTVITSLGVVRERQAGTLEQLAVMPLSATDVFLGKIVPYFAVAAIDLAVVLGVGVVLFDVPFNGSVLLLALGSMLFLFVTLGIGVLISSVSENQGQAIQLALMTLLPQILLSGLIFPLSSMPAGIRWISYVLPLTYFTKISRGVMLRGAGIGAIWEPLLYLAVLGGIVLGLATLRFRRDLAPARVAAPAAEPATAGAMR